MAEETGKYWIHSAIQGVIVRGVLVRRQVTPSWMNDPMWRHNGGNGREVWGRVWVPSPAPGRKRVEGGEGRSVLRIVAYVKINDGS